jgi:hypothetical protein
MDSKIKELIKQADEYAWEQYPDPKDWQEKRDLKFAELIIKESIEVLEKKCDTLDYGGDYESGYQHGFGYAIHYLTTHFENKQLDQPEPKICSNKVNGQCPLHNLFCQYPECEK